MAYLRRAQFVLLATTTHESVNITILHKIGATNRARQWSLLRKKQETGKQKLNGHREFGVLKWFRGDDHRLCIDTASSRISCIREVEPRKTYMHVCEGTKRKTNLKIVALIFNHYMYHGFLRRLLSYCHPK